MRLLIVIVTSRGAVVMAYLSTIHKQNLIYLGRQGLRTGTIVGLM